jgi:hypothetical protein
MIEPQVVMLEPEMVALKLLVDSWKPNLIESMIDDYFVAAKVIMPKTGKEITAEVAAAIIAAGDDAFGRGRGHQEKDRDTTLGAVPQQSPLGNTLPPPSLAAPPPPHPKVDLTKPCSCVCEQAKFDRRIKNRKRQAEADEKEAAKKIKSNVENRTRARQYFNEFVQSMPDCADCEVSRVGTVDVGAQGICEGYTCELGTGKQQG